MPGSEILTKVVIGHSSQDVWQAGEQDGPGRIGKIVAAALVILYADHARST